LFSAIYVAAHTLREFHQASSGFFSFLVSKKAIVLQAFVFKCNKNVKICNLFFISFYFMGNVLQKGLL
jgi:hypothetical protein|tara:strand:+ start:225 stop:428 length:204 start_codon:yes stop_codon:yes gene_type:complete